MTQDVASSPTAKGLSGCDRSSQVMMPGTTTSMTSNRTAYFVKRIASGNAANVIIITTGLKLGELNRNPRATSIRPWPRVTPQAVGTAQLAQTPIGTPTNAPFSELR